MIMTVMVAAVTPFFLAVLVKWRLCQAPASGGHTDWTNIFSWRGSALQFSQLMNGFSCYPFLLCLPKTTYMHLTKLHHPT